MTSNKSLWVALIVVALIAIIGIQFPKATEVIRNNVVGSVTGDTLTTRSWTVNGVRHEYLRTGLNKATTTPCAILSPSATSSYLMTGVTVTTATSTDSTVWTAARALSPYATTTQLGQATLAAGTIGAVAVNASTTVAFNGAGILAPNTFIVWGVQGTTPGSTANLNGFCEAEFIVF